MRKLIVALLLALAPLPLAAGTARDLRRFDTNSDNMMQRAELIAYFKSVGASDEEATDAARDALSAFGCILPCDHGITIAQATDVVGEVFTPKPDPKAATACKYLSLKRTVADTVDPRGPENDFPAILSYKRDEHADDTDQINVLGALEVFKCQIDRGNRSLLNLTYTVASGVDFDVDGSKPAAENDIAASLPVTILWVADSDKAAFTELIGTITPKFTTDRALDREVAEVSASVSTQSRLLARAGLRTFFPSFNAQRVSIWWQPTVFAEWVDINDAAGNDDLAALKAHSLRYGVRTDVILRPSIADDRLALKFKGFERWGSEHHSYTETFLTYNLDEDGKIQFTGVYRHGRKPPDFSAKDQWLVGIGITR